MSAPYRDVQELSRVFATLKAADPESLAQSQIEQGIPQLAMYVFLKSAIDDIFSISETRSLRQFVRQSGNRDALQALARILQSREGQADLTSVIRCVLSEYLVNLTFLLDDTAAQRFSDQALDSMLNRLRWGLFELDATGKPSACMSGLHEIIRDILADQGAAKR